MELLKRVKQEYWNLIFIAAIAVLLVWNFSLQDKVDYLERGYRLSLERYDKHVWHHAPAPPRD